MPTREAWTICAIAIISGLRCVDYRDYDSARAKWPRQQRTFFSSSSLVIVHKPLSDVLDCSHWPSRHGDSGVFLFFFFLFLSSPFPPRVRFGKPREKRLRGIYRELCAPFLWPATFERFRRTICGFVRFLANYGWEMSIGKVTVTTKELWPGYIFSYFDVRFYSRTQGTRHVRGTIQNTCWISLKGENV